MAAVGPGLRRRLWPRRLIGPRDPLADYLADIYTLSSSLAGLPGMSIPAGFGAGGMPVGLQLIGNYFKEAQLLGAAHQFQLATDWHLRNPAKQV